MLRIDKKSKQHRPRLEVNTRKGRFNRSLQIAFGAALCLHGAALLIFQISPFKVRYSETIFPPIQVRVDNFPAIDSGALADQEKENPFRFPIPSPLRAEPKIMEFMSTCKRGSEDLPRMVKMNSAPREDLCYDYYLERVIPIEGPSKLEAPMIVQTSGGLAETPFTLEGIDMEYLDSALGIGAEKEIKGISYRVKIDHRTGKVFWYSKISGEARKRVLQLCEKILASLRFEKNQPSIFSEGEIDIELMFGNGGA